MTDAPRFFVPFTDSASVESVFGQYASRCYRPVAPIEQRIYSITFVAGSEEWVATVGQRLRGTRRTVTGRGSKKREHLSSVSDPAVVLAIFAGPPFMVVTNKGPQHNVRSALENPFMAGNIRSVTYFSPA